MLIHDMSSVAYVYIIYWILHDIETHFSEIFSHDVTSTSSATSDLPPPCWQETDSHQLDDLRPLIYVPEKKWAQSEVEL